MADLAQWGVFSWGSALWGDGPAYGYQGDTDNAKQDTRLFTAGSQTVDSSQYLTDLTASGSYAAYEASSSRGAITGQWCIEHRATYANTSFGGDVIFTHGNDADSDYTFRAKVASGSPNYIELAANGILITSLPVSTGSVDRTIYWSMRPNPDTTGASDSHISEFGSYDHGAADWEVEPYQVAHAAPTTDTGWNLCVHGQWDDGGSTLNDEFAVTGAAFRLSNAFHSHVEVWEDWATRRTGSAPAVDVYAEPLPLDNDSGLGDEGEIVGPTLAYLCEHQKNAVVRGFSPLVNEVYNKHPDWTNSYIPANFMRKVVGTQMRMPLTYLRWCSIPNNASHIYARVHVRSHVNSGAAVPTKVCVVTMNFPPGAPLDWADDNEPAPVHERYYGHTTIETDHTSSGTGEWLDIGKIKIARNTSATPGWYGSTFLAIGYEIDPDNESANDANQNLEILAWQVWPLSEEPVDNGIAADQVLPQDG